MILFVFPREDDGLLSDVAKRREEDHLKNRSGNCLICGDK